MSVWERLEEHAEQAAGRLTELEHTLLQATDPQPFEGHYTRPFQEVSQLREDAHRYALMALAGIGQDGEDALGHLSDWLRNQWYLYAELKRVHLHRVHAVERKVVEWATDSREAVRLLSKLQEGVTAAFDAFQPLDRLDEMEDFTGRNIEEYWDASASASPWFTIDWASFGREDLFDATGKRAADWLEEKRYTGPEANILQVGCGAGRIEKSLAPRMGHVYGVDISSEMVALARKRLGGFANTTIEKNDGRELPFPDCSIDNAFSFLVLIHIHDPSVVRALFSEVWRVLAPGGRFVVTHASYSSRIEKLASEVGLTIRYSGRTCDRRVNSFDFFWDWMWIFERRPAVYDLAETGT